MSDTFELVRRATEALTSAGLVLNDELDCSGALVRCGTAKKPNGTDGAYKVHLDWPPTLWLCNYHEGGEGVTIKLWDKAEIDRLTETEREELQERIRREREGAQIRAEERHRKAAEKANKILKSLQPADEENTYLKRKGVDPAGRMFQDKDGALVVPVLDESGKIQSLQTIAENDDKRFDKRFMPGGRTGGGYFSIPAKDGSKDGPLLIGEGVATVSSVCMATGYAGLVTFFCGNLLAVAEMARRKYPDREIVLLADNDCETQKADGTPWNPGLEAATKAARAVGGRLAMPPAHDGRATDFNDLHAARGLDAVRLVIEEARTKEPLPELKESLPDGFSISTKGPRPGLWHEEVKENADPVRTWIGSPLHVLGETRDENSNAWGLLLSWDDPDGHGHTWAMPKELLAGKDAAAWLGRLVSEGWRCAPGTRARNLAALYLSAYRTTRRARCVPRTGWHHEAFVLPDTVYYPLFPTGRTGQTGQPYGDKDFLPSRNENSKLDKLDKERIVLQVQTPHNPFHSAGTLENWREGIGAWARGNSRLMLAISAAFAAPLLELCGMESGGFNFTGQSSTGKTTALVVGASVWGKGSSSGGYVQNWRATANGLEGMAALYSDALLCLDEIGQAPGRTIQEAAYMLANGVGKGRAYQDGSMRAVKSWRLLMLSTGEVGLAEKIREEGGRVKAGQSVRLIDVPADAGAGLGIFEELHGFSSPQVFADALKQAAATDYGHAARDFIGKVQKNRAEILSDLHTASAIIFPCCALKMRMDR